MDWKYTNEPDGKTCLAMNEGRCSWHRGKAIGHNVSKAFLKSHLFETQIQFQVHEVQLQQQFFLPKIWIWSKILIKG